MGTTTPRTHAGLALLAVLMGFAAAVAAPPADAEAELAELGITLKAAVISEAMSPDEAMKVYLTMAERLGLGKEAKDAGDDGARPKRDVMLSAPGPEQIRMLFRPEFLRRDLAWLRDELAFDHDQMAIAEVLFEEYRAAYDLASTPLREALARYRRTSTDEWLVSALERAGVSDAADAEARVRRAVEAWEVAKDGEDAGRDRVEAWTKRMVEATRTMNERLASVRDRVREELAGLNRDGVEVGADDLIRLARRLRADREHLRDDMTASLAAIATETQRGDADALLDAALARLRITHLLPIGRLSGESMDVWASLEEAAPETTRAGADVTLRTRAPAIAGALDHRTSATIDRELAGLELQAARDRLAATNGGSIFDVDDRRLAGTARPYADAVRRELSSSIAVRDALLALLAESARAIDEASPDSGVSELYRAAALRRGFPAEMRPRWSERALDAAARFDDLSPEAMEALVALRAGTALELGALREDAVGRRIRREPELAEAQIDEQLGGDDRAVVYGAELWLGMNFEGFEAIDERVEGRLRGVLTPGQFERLPARRTQDAKKGVKGAGDKGKGGGTRPEGKK